MERLANIFFSQPAQKLASAVEECGEIEGPCAQA